ncbi:MAG: hypothetical protein Q4P28_04080 [Tissierellia bacterium]|nr:hypothetical protein [Tissierellia bacterium]
MRKIFTLLLDYKDKAFKIPLFCIIALIIVYVLYKLIRKEGIIKYIPAYGMVIFGFITLIIGIKEITTNFGLQMLEYGILSLTVGIISLCFAWMLGIYHKSQVRPKRKVLHEIKK